MGTKSFTFPQLQAKGQGRGCDLLSSALATQHTHTWELWVTSDFHQLPFCFTPHPPPLPFPLIFFSQSVSKLSGNALCDPQTKTEQQQIPVLVFVVKWSSGNLLKNQGSDWSPAPSHFSASLNQPEGIILYDPRVTRCNDTLWRWKRGRDSETREEPMRTEPGLEGVTVGLKVGEDQKSGRQFLETGETR